jgi:hypothetical protein
VHAGLKKHNAYAIKFYFKQENKQPNSTAVSFDLTFLLPIYNYFAI